MFKFQASLYVNKNFLIKLKRGEKKIIKHLIKRIIPAKSIFIALTDIHTKNTVQI